MSSNKQIPTKYLTQHETELKKRINSEFYNSIQKEVQQNYRELISHAPVFRQKINHKLFEYAVPCLAIYKALLSYIPKHEAYEVMQYIVKETARNEIVNNILHRLMIQHLSHYRFIGRIYEKGLTSLKEPEGWLARHIPDASHRNTVIAFDMTRCGICEYYKKQGVPELSSVMCNADAVAADFMQGVRFQRMKTIANGDDVCDFRYFRE